VKTLVKCFVISRIDYCNSLLTWYASVRLWSVTTCNECCGEDGLWCWKISRVSSLIREQSTFVASFSAMKIYRVMHAYLSELCEEHTNADVRTRSSVRGDLATQRTKRTWRMGICRCWTEQFAVFHLQLSVCEQFQNCAENFPSVCPSHSWSTPKWQTPK